MPYQEPTLTVTPQKVRTLNATALGVVPPVQQVEELLPPLQGLIPLPADDPVLAIVEDLLQVYGGIIYVGPPGTGKTWYAGRTALALTNNDHNFVRFVQFHPSYQYEDFVEGFVPLAQGGFELRPKHFLECCKKAMDNPELRVVLVIDELSRGDPGRVFGEALTYLEKSKRGQLFRLASGTECVVPDNLVVLASMNPLDRGVDEVDAAFERRFAKIAFEPSAEALSTLTLEAGMDEGLRARVLTFFEIANQRSRTNPQAALGHTSFVGLSTAQDLQRLWEHQLRFHFDKAYRLDPDSRDEIYKLWNQVLALPAPQQDAETGGE